MWRVPNSSALHGLLYLVPVRIMTMLLEYDAAILDNVANDNHSETYIHTPLHSKAEYQHQVSKHLRFFRIFSMYTSKYNGLGVFFNRLFEI